MQPRSSDHLAFGRAIRELRGERALSQEALAHECGVDRSYMGGVERGERNISLANILRIAAALGVQPSELCAKFEATAR